MPQGLQSIPNASFPTTRSNINAEFSALYSLSSGTSYPSVTIAGMLCIRTDLGFLYQRNSTDSGWNQLYAVNAQGLVDQTGASIFITTTGSTNAYVATLSPAPTAYTTGMMLNLKLNFGNTGACTINVNGLGAKSIKKFGSTVDPVTGDLASAGCHQFMYDGTNFQLLTPVQKLTAVATTSDTMNGSLSSTMTVTPQALGALWIKGTASASSSMNISSVAGYYLVSGNLTINTINYTGVATIVAGQMLRFRFSGTPTIAHNATSLILPGAQNIKVQAGDYAEFVTEDGTNWRCINYMRANPIPANGFPTGYRGTANPVYATSTTVTVASIRERSKDDTIDIIKTTSTTLDITTTGLNGLARGATNLTGTIAYTNGSATVTGTSSTFTTDYIVGDTIWDVTNSVVVGTIKTIGSDTSITLWQNFVGTSHSSANHVRGSRAMQSIWYLYAITDGTTPGLILSTRDVSSGDTLPSDDLPVGYSATTARQIPFALILDTTATPVIIAFNCFGEGINTRYIEYQAFEQSSVFRALNAGTSTSFAGISLKPLVPKNSTHAKISYLNTYVSATGFSSFRPTGSGVTTGEQTNPVIATTITTTSGNLDMRTDSSQSIDYKVVSGINCSVFVKGFWVEVP